MEALDALGLAANIAQFVGMAGKAVQKTMELALDEKELMQENEELQLIVSDFQKNLPMLQDENGVHDVASAELKHLAEAASRICSEIDTKFESIKAKRAKKKRLQSFYATWTEMKLREVFQNLNARLAELRNQISLHINIILVQQQASVQSALVDTIKTSQDYISRLDRETAEFKTHAIIHHQEDDILHWRWLGDSEQLYSLGRSLKSLKPHYESFQRTQKILKSLYFSQVGERRDTISDPHMSTYDWVFKADTANFGPWLEHPEAPIYWIAGRAGSGKSTLMKHIHKHHKLPAGLQRWAGTRKVLIASHFFWELASQAFPDRWKAALQPVETLSQNQWPREELLGGLTNFLTEARDSCVLIFVDGLDEYSGEPDNLIEVVQTLGRLSNVKVCVSSRPWIEFSDAFSESSWKLYLHDHTRKDIERYKLHTLEAHNRFKLFKTQNPEASLELVSCITDRAEGVFLWVQLAVRSLLRGIVNADDIVDLQRRLDELMLNNISDFYKSRTAKVLLVLAHARVSLPLVTFYFLDSREGRHFDPQIFLQNWPYVNEEEAAEVERKKRQFIAQFKDLINIYEHPTKAALFNFSVGFIHRTVIEFITQSRIQDWLYQRAGPNFNPVLALFEVSLEQFKIFSHFWKLTFLHPFLRNWFLSAVYYAREIEVTNGYSVSQQLNQLQEVLSDDTDKGHFRRPSKFEAPWWRGSLKDLAISVGLWRYANDMAVSTEFEAALEPDLCIELQSDFVVKEVTDTDRDKRRGMDIKRPSYTSTLHMFTAAEADCLSDLRARRLKPIPRAQPLASHPDDGQVGRLSEEDTHNYVLHSVFSRSNSIEIEMTKPKVSRFKKAPKIAGSVKIIRSDSVDCRELERNGSQ
ncbi:hypothetical protein PFICI_14057 [Pestalotiopsis fici W106-1]|uniref:Uncharacterized protein n=1 Tax=Pestalotiopsis fici (strain W106-1 / CGMCC3.15140) TaxID=1229662 RepID=W3WMZ8_PESFW|nr:uncharacterized protein PFICI_14057 [Pestalotiopsis fici W106-1]ETS74191.1 hypothetical protein PFICI_14057 [Pestalotiopsis fici W106-1]